jgi:hypothetical protein
LGITVITFRPERTGSRIDLRGNGASLAPADPSLSKMDASADNADKGEKY